MRASPLDVMSFVLAAFSSHIEYTVNVSKMINSPPVDDPLPIAPQNIPINSGELVTTTIQVVFEYIERRGELRKEKYSVPLFLQPWKQFVHQDEFPARHNQSFYFQLCSNFYDRKKVKIR